MIGNLSLEDQVNLIKKKEIKIIELVDFYLDRIEKLNGTLNAIINLKDFDEIRDIAKLKDKSLDSNLPLNGIPFAIKDVFNVVEFPTTEGLNINKNNLPKRNSIFVNRLQKNGAIIIGKTNTSELAIGSHTVNKIFGPTANPYNLSLSAGGSSGGAATAVSMNLVPCSDGSDMMGSCRNPAAFTNLYGYRPTPGIIPELREKSDVRKMPILSTTGVISRTPKDLCYYMNCIAGKDQNDESSIDINYSFIKIGNLKIPNIFKIGWLNNLCEKYDFENEILSMCQQALKDISKIEKNIEVEINNDDLSTDLLWKNWTTIRSKIIYDNLSESFGGKIEQLSEPAQWEYKNGININNDMLRESLMWVENAQTLISKLFNQYDLLAVPSAQVFPFDKELFSPESISGNKVDTYHRWMEITVFASLFQLPSISIPVGFNKNNLPMGIQLIAPYNEDAKLLSFAMLYESMFNHCQNKPESF